ncbi:hypothetical protein [Aurantiacibacter rhizosphaerae]|uniref:Uncharacterized protein n=1 Tax=Aurantiacibacter rhizosphaerae TaxID=2691582 RepID=A0A844XG94_9SPHN|nr:hypothetical protein [Aurantiacibacter rhizosphaerae]MWV28759.1 hypothetical protein [Aurantiacibacter rhizosphaerae]
MNTLAADLHDIAALTANSGAAIPIATACVLDCHLIRFILHHETATGRLAMAQLDQFAAGADANSLRGVSGAHAQFPCAALQIIEHRKFWRLGGHW